jgi:hypothetical protein
MSVIHEEIRNVKQTNAEIIENIYTKLVKSLLQAARKAEKACDTQTRHKKKSQKTFLRLIKEDDIFKKLVETLQQKKVLAKNGNNDTSLSEEIKQIKKQIKKLQIEAMREDIKNEYFKLENEMVFSRNLFWKRARRYQRRNKTEVDENQNIEEYCNFYSKLFSHVDRPNDVEHQEVESLVQNTFENIKNVKMEMRTITNDEITTIIKNLKNGKSCGIDYISNEMVKNAVSSHLVKQCVKAFYFTV